MSRRTDYNTRRRERYRTDPEYRESEQKRKREANRKRYRADPEYRERQKADGRKRYYNLTGPEYGRRLLQIRRGKALQRMAERNQRGERDHSGTLPA